MKRAVMARIQAPLEGGFSLSIKPRPVTIQIWI